MAMGGTGFNMGPGRPLPTSSNALGWLVSQDNDFEAISSAHPALRVLGV
jgi:hypothetical protein